MTRILQKHPGIDKRKGKKSSWAHQLGTLGGGNHFIEVCLDEAEPRLGDAALGQPRHRQRDRHATSSSSRKEGREKHSSRAARRDLAYFPEGAQHFDDYVEAVGWAQDYARAQPRAR